MTVERILEEAKKLSRADQAELLDGVMQIVDPAVADVALTPTQKADLDRRLAEFRSGKAVMIDGDAVYARIRNRR